MIKTELEWSDGGRPVYLMGESFGGILCLALAHKLGDYVDRVVSCTHNKMAGLHAHIMAAYVACLAAVG
jgi:alpha-beta hydrolase superfamily lysophospholipase